MLSRGIFQLLICVLYEHSLLAVNCEKQGKKLAAPKSRYAAYEAPVLFQGFHKNWSHLLST